MILDNLPTTPKRPGRWLELGLLVLAAIIVLLSAAAVELSQGNTLTVDLMYIFGGFLAIFGVAHIAVRIWAPWADQLILPVVALLNGLGLVVIHRLYLGELKDGTSPDGAVFRHLFSNPGFSVEKQLMWTVIGVVLLVAVLLLLRDYRALGHYAYILGLLGVVLMVLPLFWPAAINADAKLWISIGPFTVQPSEFSKILLLIFMAKLLSTKRSQFNTEGYRFFGLQFPRMRDLMPILLVWALAMLIMAVANDFGPALLLFATILGMIYIASGRASWLLIGVVLIGIGGTVVYQFSDKIQTRVSNFIDPLATFDTTGRQLAEGLFGMSWGGMTGTGLGNGYPQDIPVVESDFILAAVGEELGLVGLAAVLLLFAVLVSRGFGAAMQVPDNFGKLLAAGLALIIALQLFVVVGGITAILPMTGLTTPFMSAGGSSLMSNYILVALLLAISSYANCPPELRPGQKELQRDKAAASGAAAGNAAASDAEVMS